MRSRLKKWGNSLALRIPSQFAKELGIHEDSQVEVYYENGQLVMKPVDPTDSYSLDELLEQVTEENLHGETDTGDSVGDEVW